MLFKNLTEKYSSCDFKYQFENLKITFIFQVRKSELMELLIIHDPEQMKTD